MTRSHGPSEILCERVLDAPRDLVWRAFTDVGHVSAWWGPRGFRTATISRDFTPGGRWRFTMHGPDGRRYENLVTYIEIEEPARLVYRHGGDAAVEPVRFEAITTFDESEPGRTLLRMRLRFASDSERRAVIEAYGADDGLIETVGRFAEHLSARASGVWRESVTRVRPEETALIISRVFAAPVALVWRAWTEPEMLRRWFCPLDCEPLEVSGDLRLGGEYRESMRCGGTVHTARGVYREIEPERRLVFTHRWQTPDAPETLVTVRFAALSASATEVRLTQTGLSSDDSAGSHAEGWSSCFEHLAECLSATAGRM